MQCVLYRACNIEDCRSRDFNRSKSFCQWIKIEATRSRKIFSS